MVFTALLRGLQPGIVINDRLPGHGDYVTPEQFVPATANDGRWESCETVGRGGNLLLNVSPRGDGSVPPEQIDAKGGSNSGCNGRRYLGSMVIRSQ